MARLNQLLRSNGRINKRRTTSVSELGGDPIRRGLVVKLVILHPKKPNSANRKIARVVIRHRSRRIIMCIPGIGHNLQEFAWILVRGGRANDVPGCNYTGVKGKLDFSELENIRRAKAFSKYGLKNPYLSQKLKIKKKK